jgi:hypothetical protein
MDVEDVAIEVEYVEDSFDDDDDDPRTNLGFCTVPMNGGDFPGGAKTRACGDYQMSCNEMLPTGEPSWERKPHVRKQSQRKNAYV